MIKSDKNNLTIGGKDLTQGNNAISLFTRQYHDFYLGNNSNNNESLNGKFMIIACYKTFQNPKHLISMNIINISMKYKKL